MKNKAAQAMAKIRHKKNPPSREHMIAMSMKAKEKRAGK